MSNANIDNVSYNSNNNTTAFIKQELLSVKNEYEATCNSDHGSSNNLNSDAPQTQYYQSNDHSCYYSPTSAPAPNTILITNNYTQDGRSTNLNNKNVNKSSITIVTHNSDTDPTANKMMNSANSPTVVLDRINICINNHFNNDTRTTAATKIATKGSPLSEPLYKSTTHPPSPAPPASSEHNKEKSIESESNMKNVFISRDIKKPQVQQQQHQQSQQEHHHIAGSNNIFSNGEDVLVQRKDGRFYLGTIVAISRNQCLIKFDDNTEYWSNFEHLSKLSDDDSNNDPMCVVCKKVSKIDNVEVCERCRRGYHPKCAEGSFQKNGIWFCRRCTAPNGLKNKNKENDKYFSGYQTFVTEIMHKSQLPYNPDSLSWDEYHRVNLEQIYCYCGKNGEWYNKMLQCCQCQQWFHEKCVNCLTGPIYAGDLFYVFSCTMCNGGKEFLRRLELKWNDIVHLLLFNITLNKNKKYYHADNVIVPYAIDNWPLLQLQLNIRNLSAVDIRDNVIRTLSMNNSRFKCGREIKKGQFFWGLRSRIPPPAPKIIIPPEVEISEQYLRHNTKLNIIQQKSSVDIPKDIDAKMTGKLYLDENSDNESSSTNSDPKFTSDDEVPIKKIVEREKIEIKNDIDHNIKNIIDEQKESIPVTVTSLPSESINNALSNEFSSTESSDKSSDYVDYEGIKEGEESMDVDIDVEDVENNVKAKKIHIKHSRKRKSPFFTNLIHKNEAKTTEVIDICDSSDENSSRGTLDLIIPPPKNFQGKNNPFRLTPKKKENHNISNNNNNNNNNISKEKSHLWKPAKKLDSTNFLHGSLNQTTAGQFRIVRTVKRRLSAKDIMIGPNKEIKRRRLKRRSGNVEVISTTTIQSLPKSAAYLPIRTDSKELPVSAIRSTLNSASSSTSSTATTPTNLGSITNVFNGCGRRLRQRQGKNYSESQRRNSNSSVGSTVCSSNGGNNGGGSTSGISGLNHPGGLSGIPGSPNKGGGSQSSDVSLSELQTSLNMYFGAANRIANGENFSVRAKRLSPNGKVQYLIEWEGIS